MKYFFNCLYIVFSRDEGRKIVIKVLLFDLFRSLSCLILYKKLASVFNVEGVFGLEVVNVN